MKNKDVIKAHFQGTWDKFYSKYIKNNLRRIGQKTQFQTLCPFHEDKNPSFTINSETGEFYCYGCQEKGHAFHFYAKINDLEVKRDFPKILKGIAEDFGIECEISQPRFVKAYDYTDEKGILLFQVVRYEPKTFKQRRPNGNGNWIYDLKGVERVLYKLPNVIQAQEVLIVEGEKDADTVTELGFAGTTSPMGAKKWQPEYSECLKDKDVILIPDNDIEGREHMTQVGAALSGIAKSIKWLDLPDLPSKGDVSDWAANYSDKAEAAERLAILIEEAKPYKAPKHYTIEDAVLDTRAYLSLELPAKRKIIDIFSEQEIILVSGWRGAGKTWMGLSVVDAITRGVSFGPWKSRNSVPCLYCDGEMAAQDIQTRLKSLCPDPERLSPLHIYSDAYANILGLPKANLLSETWRMNMKRILIARGVKFWVIDNIASLASGIDENSKKDWDQINTWLIDLRFAGISTMLLHHVGKEGQQRGTSAREDNIDMSIILKQPSGYVPDQGACFILGFSKSRLSFEDLSLIQEYKFQLTRTDNGRFEWIWGNVRGEIKQEVLKMLNEGLPYDDIADAIGISKGRISQIKKEAVETGQIDKHGKYIELK